MKYNMSWHKECLRNRTENTQRLIEQVNQIQGVINRQEKEIEFYKKQIVEAEKRGLLSFDRERFLIKKDV